MDESAAALHLRYLDWCSGQIARRLAELSASEVWERVQRVRGSAAAPASGSLESPLTQAEALTFEIMEELALPEFERWLEQYRADPGPFDREILGFSAPDGSTSGPAHSRLPPTG